jgi:hypothetical protein
MVRPSSSFAVAVCAAAALPLPAHAALDGLQSPGQLGLLLLVAVLPFLIGGLMLRAIWRLGRRAASPGEPQAETRRPRSSASASAYGWLAVLMLSLPVLPLAGLVYPRIQALNIERIARSPSYLVLLMLTVILLVLPRHLPKDKGRTVLLALGGAAVALGAVCAGAWLAFAFCVPLGLAWARR